MRCIFIIVVANPGSGDWPAGSAVTQFGQGYLLTLARKLDQQLIAIVREIRLLTVELMHLLHTWMEPL